MNWYETFSQWAGWFWPFFINHLWQATLFWALAWAAATSLARTSLRARSVIWSIALLKFALPVVLLFSLLGVRAPSWSRGLNGVESGVAAMRVFFELLPPGESTPAPGGALGRNDFFSALTLLWWIGALFFFARWVIRRGRFKRELSVGVWTTAGRGFEVVREAKALLGVDRRVRLLLSDRIGETGVWGTRRPIIVAPMGLFDCLDDQELRGLMLHELAHVQRRDNLLASMQMMACCFCWFHPLVWWIDRRLLAEREMLCDEKVLRLGKSPESYIAGLCKTVQFGLGCSVRGVSRAAGSDLKRRIDYMASSNFTVNHSFSRRLIGVGTAAAVGAVALMIGLLFGDGARAQEKSKGAVSEAQTSRPKILYQEKAEYTEEAKEKGIEGVVQLSVVFGADGAIGKIEILKGLPGGLMEEAVAAARKIRFEPARKDGRSVDFNGTIEFTFSLQ